MTHQGKNKAGGQLRSGGTVDSLNHQNRVQQRKKRNKLAKQARRRNRK